MTTLYFADVLADGRVRACLPGFASDDGALSVPGVEGRAVLLDKPVDWRGLFPSSVLYWDDELGLHFIETEALADLQAAAIAKTYPDVDAVYQDAIGMRATEYARAEEAARQYMAAEVRPAIVSGYLEGHARSNPTGQQQTAEWAARQIIERADAFRWAELQMRNVRFDRQADMRAATTHADLAAAVGEWNSFITWIRATLGLQQSKGG